MIEGKNIQVVLATCTQFIYHNNEMREIVNILRLCRIIERLCHIIDHDLSLQVRVEKYSCCP